MRGRQRPSCGGEFGQSQNIEPAFGQNQNQQPAFGHQPNQSSFRNQNNLALISNARINQSPCAQATAAYMEQIPDDGLGLIKPADPTGMIAMSVGVLKAEGNQVKRGQGDVYVVSLTDKEKAYLVAMAKKDKRRMTIYWKHPQ